MQGVGRVVWKRDQANADPERPAGMGVKFIKIDEESRAVIEKLLASRGPDSASAYDAGTAEARRASEPAPATPAPSQPPPSQPSAKELLEEALRDAGPGTSSVPPASSAPAGAPAVEER